MGLSLVISSWVVSETGSAAAKIAGIDAVLEAAAVAC